MAKAEAGSKASGRLTPTTKIIGSKRLKFFEDGGLPGCPKLGAGAAEPAREQDLKEGDKSRGTQLGTRKLDPNLATPEAKAETPKRAKLRGDDAKSRHKKSEAGKTEPT